MEPVKAEKAAVEGLTQSDWSVSHPEHLTRADVNERTEAPSLRESVCDHTLAPETQLLVTSPSPVNGLCNYKTKPSSCKAESWPFTHTYTHRYTIPSIKFRILKNSG